VIVDSMYVGIARMRNNVNTKKDFYNTLPFIFECLFHDKQHTQWRLKSIAKVPSQKVNQTAKMFFFFFRRSSSNLRDSFNDGFRKKQLHFFT